MADSPFWAAISAVRSGLSARAGLRAFRAGGGAVADSTWFKMVTEARNTVAGAKAELDAPLNRRPTATEATRWTTVNASGWLQQVNVIAKDRTTGEVISIPYSVTGTRPITRQQAIEQALDTYTPDSGSPPGGQQILGAVYAGSILMEAGGR